MPSSRWGIGRFYLSESKCTVSARFLHGFKTCKECKSLQNRTKGAETRSSKSAVYRWEMTLKRNFQKLRELPGMRYESVGRGFESLPSHQVKSHDWPLKIRCKSWDFLFYNDPEMAGMCLICALRLKKCLSCALCWCFGWGSRTVGLLNTSL